MELAGYFWTNNGGTGGRCHAGIRNGMPWHWRPDSSGAAPASRRAERRLSGAVHVPACRRSHHGRAGAPSTADRMEEGGRAAARTVRSRGTRQPLRDTCEGTRSGDQPSRGGATDLGGSLCREWLQHVAPAGADRRRDADERRPAGLSTTAAWRASPEGARQHSGRSQPENTWLQRRGRRRGRGNPDAEGNSSPAEAVMPPHSRAARHYNQGGKP